MSGFSDLVVRVVANTRQFRSGMRDAGQTVDRFQRNQGNAAAGTRKFSQALTGMAVGGASAAAAALAGLAIRGEQFERSMKRSMAIIDATPAQMHKMRAAAIDTAAATQFSANETARAYFFLASAGMTAEQQLAALPQVAAFAQAGNFDLAHATDLATDAQSALGLTSQDAARNLENLKRVTDTLVGANTLANASVEQFSTALTTKAGASMRLLGMEIEEGISVLAAFADQGVKGEQAGTALSIVLRDLTTKALENKAAFEQNRVAVFDSAGEFRSMADIIGELETRLSGMSDAQRKATLLQMGFTDKSLAYLQSLIGTSDKMRTYLSQLKEMDGVTQRVAGDSLTSLQKALAELDAEFTRIGVSIGEAFGELTVTSIRTTTSLLKGLKTVGRVVFAKDLREALTVAGTAASGRSDEFEYISPNFEKFRAMQPPPAPARSPEEIAEAMNQERLNESLNEYNKLLEAAAKRAEDAQSPYDRYRDQMKGLNELYRAGKVSADEYGTMLGEMRARLNDAVAASAEAARQTEEYQNRMAATETLRGMQEELDLLTGKLTEAQRALQRFSDQPGVTDEQIARFRELQRQMEDVAKREQAKRELESLAREYETPEERAARRLREIEDLQQRAGGMDPELARRIRADIDDELERSRGRTEAAGTRFAGANEVGSLEAYRQRLATLHGSMAKDPAKDTAKNTEKLVAQNQELIQATREQSVALRDTNWSLN